MKTKQYLEETRILDFSNPIIQSLIAERNWNELNEKKKIKSIYDFVRDEILFGYNRDDSIPASQVLREGYGQCNTKSNLLMALLRSVGIPCRFHGFTVDKRMQKGAVSGLWYKVAPEDIIHSWVEVYYKGKWLNLEGIILDRAYLQRLQSKFDNCGKNFCGYGVSTDRFDNPQIDWDENSTYIQKDAIKDDLGVYDNPDEFYKIYQQKLSFLKRMAFFLLIRRHMNNNVKRIRNN